MKKYLTKRYLTLILALACILGYGVSIAGSISMEDRSNDTNIAALESILPTMEEKVVYAKIPMVMVDDKLYYDTGKESTIEARCGVMDGEITSCVDVSETPIENNQSNFGSGYGYQYGIDNTIEIFMNEKWYVFEYRSGDGSQIRFGDIMYNTGDLSEKTVEWLHWYNSLTIEEKNY